MYYQRQAPKAFHHLLELFTQIFFVRLKKGGRLASVVSFLMSFWKNLA